MYTSLCKYMYEFVRHYLQAGSAAPHTPLLADRGSSKSWVKYQLQILVSSTDHQAHAHSSDTEIYSYTILFLNALLTFFFTFIYAMIFRYILFKKKLR